MFAGGFMSVHAGEIPIESVAEQLASYLTGFDAILELYRTWTQRSCTWHPLQPVLEGLPSLASRTLTDHLTRKGLSNIFDAYNTATHYATHRTRSVRSAFDLLSRINRGFQEAFRTS